MPSHEVGWCQDYSDPYDFINVLLDGGTIQDENNKNVAYFNNPVYDRRMERAAKLVGAARLQRLRSASSTTSSRRPLPGRSWSQPAKQFFFSDTSTCGASPTNRSTRRRPTTCSP